MGHIFVSRWQRIFRTIPAFHPMQKLDGMADAFVELQGQDNAGDLGHGEWLALLLDREAAHRTTKRFKTRLRAAKLRHVGAAIEDVDYRSLRKLDKTLTSQLPVDKWHDVIGEPTFADAILDRLVHNAYRLELDGPSMRKMLVRQEEQNT